MTPGPAERLPAPPAGLDPLSPTERRRARRRATAVLLLLDALVLAVGVAASADLRRLRTPEGTAEAWLDRATGDGCREALADLLAPGALRLADVVATGRAGLCAALRAPGHEEVRGSDPARATGPGRVVVAVHRAGGPDVAVPLERVDGTWRVASAASTVARARAARG